MKNVVVFCGSSMGNDAIFEEKAKELGALLTIEKRTLVYGGAKVGLMGVIADTVLSNGGKAIGVIPAFLRTKEVAHTALTDLIVVPSMHDRKAKMLELGDGMIALPGGFGTLEELFEVLTWAQLGLHGKPIGLLNVNGYFSALIEQLDQMTQSGFLKAEHKAMLLASSDPKVLLQKMDAYVAPEAPKWITDSAQT